MTRSQEERSRVNKWALSLLVCGVLLLMFSFLVQPSTAVKDNDVRTHSANIKDTAEHGTKCWKMMPPDDQNDFPADCGVCVAYEELLNTVCEPPEKLGCDWTVPPGDKRFRKLKWTELDPHKYWGLIKDLSVCGIRKDLREGLWKKDEARVRKALDEGKLRLSVTTVDIDHDGHEEQVVRCQFLPTKYGPGSIFGVMDPQTKRLDWQRNNLLLGGINGLAYYGNEILLYEGKAYMFKMEYDPNEPETHSEKAVTIHEGFSLSNEFAFGSLNLCHFIYLKGRK
jgi:hypothetical protein